MAERKWREVNPDSLILEVGDSVEGLLGDIYEETDYSGNVRKMVIIDANTTDVHGLRTIPLGAVLERKIKNVPPDSYVRITRLPDVRSDKDRDVKQFRVEVAE